MNIIQVHDQTIEALGDTKVLVNGEPMKPEDTERILNIMIKAMISIVR